MLVYNYSRMMVEMNSKLLVKLWTIEPAYQVYGPNPNITNWDLFTKKGNKKTRLDIKIFTKWKVSMYNL